MSCKCVLGSPQHFLAEVSKLFPFLADDSVSSHKDLYECAADDSLGLTESDQPRSATEFSKYATDPSLWSSRAAPKLYIALVEKFKQQTKCMHCRMGILGHVSSFVWTIIPNEYGEKL